MGRPLALLCCPNGIDDAKFFQKHAWHGDDPEINLVKNPQAPNEEPLICIDSLDGLLVPVQSATLEIPPWGTTLADWQHPDTIVIDLDPGDEVPWQAAIDTAQEVRRRLGESGLATFVMTSGGKGLHVVAPLQP